MSSEVIQVNESPGYYLAEAADVPPGYKWTEGGIIPEEWSVSTLFHELEPLVAGVSVNSVAAGIQAYGHQKYILKTSCVFSGRFTPNESKLIAPFDLQRAKTSPSVDSLIISRMNTPDLVGECGFVDRDYPNHFLPDRLWISRGKQNRGTSTRWLSYLLSTQTYREKIRVVATGTSGSMKNLSKRALLALPVPFPCPEEQRIIAEALSDVDGLLGALERLIAKKRAIKQAAMQQLLTGKTRLPGFSGEWEQLVLGELIDLIPSGIYGYEKDTGTLVGMPVATTAHIDSDNTWNYKEMEVRFFSESQVVRYAPSENDMIVVKSSGSAASIQSGKIGFVSNEKAGSFIFSNFLMLLRPVACNPRFLFYQLTSERVKRMLPYLVEASTYPNIRINDYLEIVIPLPLEEEQTAIETVLSDMDAEIEALELQQDKTRAIKQGMMQQLLTGKVRLVNTGSAANA